MAKKKQAKNSLVGNINRRKKAGTSRSKQDSTISPQSYELMKQNWGKPKKQAKKKAAKKKAAKKSAKQKSS